MLHEPESLSNAAYHSVVLVSYMGMLCHTMASWQQASSVLMIHRALLGATWLAEEIHDD